ncbi:hypothetical protein LS81_010350 [Helicobacter trogontum]|uniref:Uncharacterized protein n=1 Tax=Helicobacter trogontum TaxID=50960 RepID=A0A4U8S1Z4_9HELI|nr:hypothetical protein [Helicobacter trogontum]TLD79720.1 hypothetical protein LS81_010350 [Helicobacter trogontum]
MKITNLLILSLILVIYSGCYDRYAIVYPDDDRLFNMCVKAHKKGLLYPHFYDDVLKDISPDNITRYDTNIRDTYYLHLFVLPNINRQDYIFGKDRKENNIYKVTINADKETIESLKAELLLESNKNSIDRLQRQIFVLENYYLEYTEQRIDQKTLITKVERVLKNKKTHDIAMREIDYYLYADRYKSLPEDKTWQTYDTQYPARGSCI